MNTDPDEPARTVTSPERVSTSRSTGPLTVSVRSNSPCGFEAKTAVEENSTTSTTSAIVDIATATVAKPDRLDTGVKRKMERRESLLFISVLAPQVAYPQRAGQHACLRSR